MNTIGIALEAIMAGLSVVILVLMTKNLIKIRQTEQEIS